MDVPTADIEACRDAHLRVVEAISSLSDSDVAQPSLLPGWTVGHVLSHLARNAESACRRIDGAVRGELVAQYEGGAAGRAAEIEAGVGRPAVELVRDVLEWSTRLDEAFAGLPGDCWDRPVRTVGGEQHPVAALPFRRWREVEVHLVDLGIGITPAAWPPGLVERWLPQLLEGLPGRADAAALLAWLLGRGAAPPLHPWG